MIQLIAHNGLPAGLKRFDLIKLLSPISSRLGLKANDLRYLEYMIGRTLVSDFDTGQICMTWVAVDKIAADLGWSARTVSRIEKRLEQFGLIRRVLSAHKRRFGSRDAAKRIVYACGIDLGPLINRAAELRHMLLAHQEEFTQRCTLQTEIRACLKHIRAFDLDAALSAAKNLLPRLRPAEVQCIPKLRDILSGLGAIIAQFKGRHSRTETTAEEDKDDRPNIDLEPISLTCSRPPNLDRKATKPEAATPAQIVTHASEELRGAIALYASGSGEAPCSPSWETLQLAARDTAFQAEVSRKIWENALLKLGEEYVVLAFAVVHRNAQRTGTRWHVDNVPACFTNLIKAASHDKSCIDRIWAALVHECGVQT
jgi:hypothetical protein